MCSLVPFVIICDITNNLEMDKSSGCRPNNQPPLGRSLAASTAVNICQQPYRGFRVLAEFLKLNVPEIVIENCIYAFRLPPEAMFELGYPVYTHNGDLVFKYMYGAEPAGSQSEEGSELNLALDRYPTPNIAWYRRTCVRCHGGFLTTKTKYITQERCRYHSGKLTLYGTNQGRWTCCGSSLQDSPCCSYKFHVWNGAEKGMNPIQGYVKTQARASARMDGGYGVYALDCEMSYTVAGLELTKITVIALDGECVYDVFVKPSNEVVDFNTKFSGVTQEDLQGPLVKSLEQVQDDLLGFISAETILIGHGLDNDLRALKIIHWNIVDTAWVFPHQKGLPFRFSLKHLVEMYLQRSLERGSYGHDSYDDARAAMELVLFAVRQRFGSAEV